MPERSKGEYMSTNFWSIKNVKIFEKTIIFDTKQNELQFFKIINNSYGLQTPHLQTEKFKKVFLYYFFHVVSRT